MGEMQAAVEHRTLRGGHDPQKQDPLAGRQYYQLHLPSHRVLGVSIHCQLGQLTQTRTHARTHTRE